MRRISLFFIKESQSMANLSAPLTLFFAQVTEFQFSKKSLCLQNSQLHGVFLDGNLSLTVSLLDFITVVGGFTFFVVVLQHSSKRSCALFLVLLVDSSLLFFFLQSLQFAVLVQHLILRFSRRLLDTILSFDFHFGCVLLSYLG
jgi:hypothetical protein